MFKSCSDRGERRFRVGKGRGSANVLGAVLLFLGTFLAFDGGGSFLIVENSCLHTARSCSPLDSLNKRNLKHQLRKLWKGKIVRISFLILVDVAQVSCMVLQVRPSWWNKLFKVNESFTLFLSPSLSIFVLIDWLSFKREGDWRSFIICICISRSS